MCSKLKDSSQKQWVLGLCGEGYRAGSLLCQEIDLPRFLIFPLNIEPEREGRVEKK